MTTCAWPGYGFGFRIVFGKQSPVKRRVREGSGGRLDVWTPAKSSIIDNVLPSLSGSTLCHFLAHSSKRFELISIKPASSAT